MAPRFSTPASGKPWLFQLLVTQVKEGQMIIHYLRELDYWIRITAASSKVTPPFRLQLPSLASGPLAQRLRPARSPSAKRKAGDQAGRGDPMDD